MPDYGGMLTQVVPVLFSIVVSALVAYRLDSFREAKRNKVELRKEHLRDIKDQVLQPMLVKLIQYTDLISGNLCDRSKEPSTLKDPVPIKSKLYDSVQGHFPQVWRTWELYRRSVEEWGEKCTELFDQLKDSAEKSVEGKLPDSNWHSLAYDLVKDVYYGLFSSAETALASIEAFEVTQTGVRYGGEYGASMGIKYEDVPKAETMKSILRSLVEKSGHLVKEILDSKNKLEPLRQEADSAIREALPTLDIKGTCGYCK